jgi:outer membrane protein assembly factor BamB
MRLPTLQWTIGSLAAVSSMVMMAADWPQFRGPNRTGISQEQNLLEDWPKAGPELLWQAPDLGDGYGAPSVAGDRLYLVSNRGMDNEFVQAIAASNGSVIWTRRLGPVGRPDQQPPYPMARSTPSLDGPLLYAFSSNGDLACMEAATGKVLWQKNVEKEFGGVSGTWAYAESPLIDGDVLVVTPGGPDATMVALNKISGALIWKSAVPGGDRAAYSSAIAATAAGRKQYVQFLDKGLVGIDANTGQFLWRYTQTSGGPANIASPVIRGNYVYSTNARRFGAGLVQLIANNNGVSAEQAYFERDLPNSLGGQVLVGDTLFGTNPEGPVAANFDTGKILWRVTNIGPGSVTYAGGRLVFHLESGEVVMADANSKEYKERGRFTPPNPPARKDGRERAWAYPVISNGRLYIRDLGKLWAYDINRPAEKVIVERQR